MTVLYPLWFWLLPFFAFYLLYRRKTKTPPVWNARSILLALSGVFIVIALARPVIPQAPVDIERRGSDVIFAVDISRSMQAADIAPNRLEAARQLLASVVQADDEDRFGVVAFTTNPIILSPLTRDDE
ncbi:MAG: VWA domain-containing protein, partial [Campylobacterales bacterium]